MFGFGKAGALAVVGEVLFALQRERDAYEKAGARREAEQYQVYCDAFNKGVAVLHGKHFDAAELRIAKAQMMQVWSPEMINRLFPVSRQQVIYNQLYGYLRRLDRTS